MSFANNVYNTVNAVTQTSWTPGIAFGGGSTGITYTTQLGAYQRIGNIVFVHFTIVLSAKGSSTGNATITGLPVSVNATAGQRGSVGNSQNITAPAGSTYYAISFTASTTTASLGYVDADSGTSGNLDDTHFANNSFISGSGFYFV